MPYVNNKQQIGWSQLNLPKGGCLLNQTKRRFWKNFPLKQTFGPKVRRTESVVLKITDINGKIFCFRFRYFCLEIGRFLREPTSSVTFHFPSTRFIKCMFLSDWISARVLQLVGGTDATPWLQQTPDTKSCYVIPINWDMNYEALFPTKPQTSWINDRGTVVDKEINLVYFFGKTAQNLKKICFTNSLTS